MELEVTTDLIARHSHGQTFLSKGERFSTPDNEAQALLQRFPQYVRPYVTERNAPAQRPVAASGETIVCDPAIRPDGRRLSAIYWEAGSGRILGPAVPEFLARERDCFWIVTTFKGQARWINADQLRSKQAFEQQPVVREVEIVRF